MERDLIETFEDLLHFLDEHKQRTVPILQTRILLISKCDLVMKKLNHLLQEITYSADYKIKVIFQILEQATKILNQIPEVEELKQVKFEYLTLTNFLRMNLAAIHRDSELAQSYSTASILSHMLMEKIDTLQELPELPDFNDDPNTFMDRFIPICNNLQSTCGIYNTLLTYVSIITKPDVIAWSRELVWTYKLYEDLYDRFDIRGILQTGRLKDVADFIDRVFTFSISLMDMSKALVQLHTKYAGSWPSEIDNYGLIDEFSLEALETLIIRTIEKVDKKITDLRECYQQMLISRNDNPDDHELLTKIELEKKELKLLCKIFEFYQVDDRGNVASEIVERTDNLLSYIELITGSREAIMSGTLLGNYLKIIEEALPFVAYLAVDKGSLRIFEDYRFEKREILENQVIDLDSSLYFIKLLSKLYVETHFKEEIKFDKLYFELEENLTKFDLKPRVYLCINILMAIASYLGEQTDPEMRMKLFQEITYKDLLFNQVGQTVVDFQKYSEMIESVDMGVQNEDFDLDYRKQIKPLDVFSWLIPDFEDYFKKANKVNVPYIPFNLATDSIIEEMLDN